MRGQSNMRGFGLICNEGWSIYIKTISIYLPIFSLHKALSMLVLNKDNIRLTVYALFQLFNDDDEDRKMFDVHGYEHKVIE